MNVAESSPASWPSVASSTSTVKPRRSAQRWYMRSSISVQSCASVPPAPACTSHTASSSSYSPEKSDCSSSALSRVCQRVDRLDQLGLERGVTVALRRRLLGQLEQRPGVVEGSAQTVELLEIGRHPAELLGDGAGVVGVVPQVGARHLGLELGPSHLELLAPEVALGLGQPLPQRFELGCEVAGCLGRRALRRRHGRT